MGKAPKLLTIGVTDNALMETAPIVKLIEQGHTVYPVLGGSYDLILGPECCGMAVTNMKHLPIAIKGARARKYPPKPKGAKDVDGTGATGDGEPDAPASVEAGT